MTGNMMIYGHGDTDDPDCRTPETFKKYIADLIFSKYNGRHLFTKARDTDLIVLSRKGLAYGRFSIFGRETPNVADLKLYSRAKCVYLVASSALYERPVSLWQDFRIRVNQSGVEITEKQLLSIENAAGNVFVNANPSFIPADERERILAEIVRRRGQPAFREQLLSVYQGRCAATGCDASDALEAAHIDPYLGDFSNVVTNGILLRSDIHTLFDLGLLAINPEDMTITLAPKLTGTTYRELNGTRIQLPAHKNAHPSQDSLCRRWELFKSSKF